MNKDIQFTGYAAAPSDYECNDGELACALNLIAENDHLVAVSQPKGLLNLLPGERVLFIHHVAGQNNYILYRMTNDTNCIYWKLKSDSDGEILDSTADAILIGECPSVMQVTAIGNTLCIATSAGLRFALWKDGEYNLMQNRPPFISIDFTLNRIKTLTDSKTFNIPARCAPGWDLTRGPATASELAQFTQMAFGLLNASVAENITKKGCFYQPFFIRYAYRLYDGSYSWHSAPILMLPTIIPPLIRYSDDGSHPAADETVEATLTLDVPYFALAYRILPDNVSGLSQWTDIVKGIDVFVSAPIYTYNQSKDLIFRPVETTYHLLSNASPEYIVNGLHNIGFNANKVFIGHYGDVVTGKSVDHYMDVRRTADNPDYYRCLNILPHEQMYQNMETVNAFYKIAEIDVEHIKAMTQMEYLNLMETDLSSLVTRQTLPDEYRSHCTLVPSVLYAFNSRLNLAGVKIAPAPPFPMRSVMQFGNPQGLSSKGVRITVWTRINGVKCKAVHYGIGSGEADIWYAPSDNFPRYIFYPDASAYKMEIYISDSEKYVINLKPHAYLNGSYYFRGMEGMTNASVPPEAEAESDDCPDSVCESSKIYTSEVNNPFVFPPLGINTVGSGDVYAICSAAKALSQGQFGQFPLYAFTSEGVWALETNSSGTYSARQPITRDVCINNNHQSITQIDSAVLFASDRGIMLISGSQVQSLSDSINTDYPFNILDLPHLSELHSSLVKDLTPDSCLPTLPFTEFLKDCRMIYDYVHQRIMVYNAKVTYAYVYSLKSRQWGMAHSDIVEGIPSYPEALAVHVGKDGARTIVDFCLPSEALPPQLLVTRPLSLGYVNIHKTVDSVIQRGHFRKGHVQSVLYGSRDLIHWHLVWSGKDHLLRGFRGTPYKYFRIVLLCALAPGESIYGASVQFTPRLNNQPR